MPGAANNWQMGNIMMFKLLDKAQTAPSGEHVRQALEYAKSRGGAMGSTTIFDTAKKRIFAAAQFDWAEFWAGCTYDIDDKIKVSGGDSGVDIVMGKLDSAQNSIKDYMGDSLWTLHATSVTTYGDETEPFYGIPDMMNATGSFGGIAYTDLGTFTRDGSTAYIWTCYDTSNAYTMSFEVLQRLARNCRVGSDNSKQVLTLIVTSASLKDSFENGLQTQQQHYDPDLVKAGFDHVNFRTGTPVVVDDKCTASYVHGFNTNKLYLRPHEDFNFTPPKWKEPTNGSSMTCQVMWAGAFTTSERRAHGRMTNVGA